MSSGAIDRPRRGTKRERTRAALVAATLDLITEKGFAAASLDDIAARAGMTKGAIYSNFASKAELLLEAMRAKGFTLAPPQQPPASVAEALEVVADGLVTMTRRAAGEAGFLAEFQLQALADADLRRGLAAIYTANFDAQAAGLDALPDLGTAMPARRLAVTVQSLALGFLVQSLLTPGEITKETILGAFSALAQGLTVRPPP
ncbi:MAG TPA: helix-turn-helix domain-containing protein [Caulobacteraceae bacterium]|nr:helix-turn-helix domain-containing protein [Caulobacteraceae bacterium]